MTQHNSIWYIGKYLCIVAGVSNALVTTCQADEDHDKIASEVVVTASRSWQRILDTSASIDLIRGAQIHQAQAEVNLSEPLVRAPGIFALNRQNYAQDILISSRGFGANSAFGARGLKIIVDGIPGTVADGQGQMSHIDLGSAERVEVMRGPFSVLYGNSAGGVINVTTESGRSGMELSPYFYFGASGFRKIGTKYDGGNDQGNYLLNFSSMEMNGYRDHSIATRQNENAKVNLMAGPNTTITVIANHVNLHAQDPLGLTAAQLASDRRQSGTGATTFNTRKSVDQSQAGVVIQQTIGDRDTLTLKFYDGDRDSQQFLASSVNGVVNLNRNFYGVHFQWSHGNISPSTPYHWMMGVDRDGNQDHRQTFVNASGRAMPSKTDQDYAMGAHALDVFLQTQFLLSESVTLDAGIRRSDTQLNVDSNNALTGLGVHRYTTCTGMFATSYALADNSRVYASYGLGFDNPTLNQVLYSPNYVASGGLNTGNIGLQAARTHQFELGWKASLSASTEVRLAAFRSQTNDDILVGVSNGGKTSYLNAPRTSRNGFELSGDWAISNNWRANLALTALQATVGAGYREAVIGASTPTSIQISSGNHIPGVPSRGIFAELAWVPRGRGIEGGLELRAVDHIAVNDVNSAYAAGYALINARVVAKQQFANWAISEFVRIDNVFDRSYVGSVIVNQTANQFYESAPGRSVVAGMNVNYRF